MTIYEDVTAAIDEADKRLRRAGLTKPKMTIDLTPGDFSRFFIEASMWAVSPAKGATGKGKPVHRVTYRGHVIRTGFVHGVLRDGSKR